MSNDVKRRTDPFSGPLAKANTVGNTIGSRREIAKREPASESVQRPAVDKFSKKTTNTQKSDLFASKADYKTSNRPVSSEKPYVPSKLFGLENGMLPKPSDSLVNMEDDGSKLDFLDKVLNTPELHNGASIRKAAVEKSKAIAARKAPAKPQSAKVGA